MKIPEQNSVRKHSLRHKINKISKRNFPNKYLKIHSYLMMYFKSTVKHHTRFVFLHNNRVQLMYKQNASTTDTFFYSSKLNLCTSN